MVCYYITFRTGVVDNLIEEAVSECIDYIILMGFKVEYYHNCYKHLEEMSCKSGSIGI